VKSISITAFIILFSPFFIGSSSNAQSTPNVIKPPVAKSSVAPARNRPTLERNPLVNTNDRSKQVPNSVNIPTQDPRQQSGAGCPACGMG
jgi:hypothetical protein